jgi:hypothetical protein
MKKPFNWGPLMVMVVMAAGIGGVSYLLSLVVQKVVEWLVGM